MKSIMMEYLSIPNWCGNIKLMILILSTYYFPQGLDFMMQVMSAVRVVSAV
jgi:hypothetical protein